MRLVYAFLPRLGSFKGHVFPYHASLQKILQDQGCQYRVFYPQKAQIVPPNDQWYPWLANDFASSRKNGFQKLYFFLKNLRPFRKAFKQIRNMPEGIVFLEHFEVIHLCSILVALIGVRPQFQLWLLHRYGMDPNSLKAKVYRALHHLFEWTVGKNNIRYLTDSELIGKELKEVFHHPFTVVPIPHVRYFPRSYAVRSEIRVWVPGEVARQEKGLSSICPLIEKLKSQPKIRLFLSEEAKTKIVVNEQIAFLPHFLSQEEYETNMREMDCILLPYDPQEYRIRTSGIFVEAICAGLFCLVTRGTWMAFEYERFDLQELTVSWQEEDLLSRISSIKKEARILEKLERMQQEYLSFHSAMQIGKVFC